MLGLQACSTLFFFFDSPPGISLLLPYAIPECFSLFRSLQNEIKTQLGWGPWLLLVGRNDDVLIFFFKSCSFAETFIICNRFFLCVWICIRPVMGKLEDMGGGSGILDVTPAS